MLILLEKGRGPGVRGGHSLIQKGREGILISRERCWGLEQG